MASAGRYGSHDITLEDRSAGTPKYGYMLHRPKGHRLWQVHDAQTIPPRIITAGEYTQAETVPEIAVPWYQENWQAGMGLVNHRIGNGNVGIAEGYKVDTTSPSGVIKLARLLKLTTTTLIVPAEYTPSGFAMVGTEVWSFLGRDAYTWDYTDKHWDGITSPYAATRVCRNGVPLGANVYVPRWFTNGYPNGYMYKADADAAWTLSTLNVRLKYMAKVNNQIWGAYEATLSNETTFRGESAAGLAVTVTTVLFLGDTTATYANGDHILLERGVAAKEEVIKLTSAGTYPTETSYTSYTCLRGQYGTADVGHTIDEDCFEYTVAPVNVRSSTDPTNTGSWAAASTVGTTDAEITALVAYDNGTAELCLVCKTDGLWTLTDAGTQVHLYTMTAEQHPDHFRGAFAWDGNLRVILPLGAGGMYELYGDVIRDISFSQTMPDQTHLHGRVVAGAADATRVFLLVQETANTKYHLMMGMLVSIGGSTDYRWHHIGAIAYVTSTTPTQCSLYACGVPSGANVHHRIWVGVNSTGGTQTNYTPRFYTLDNDTEDRYSGDDDSYAITVKDDRGHPNASKRYDSVTFTTANLGAGANDHYIEVKYRVDSGSWTYVTGAQAGSTLTSTSQTLTFAAEITGKILEYQLLFFQGTTTTTGPEILDMRTTAQFRPDPEKLYPVALELRDGMPQRNGARYNPVSNGALAQLRTWNAQAAEVTLRDPDNTARNVLFLPGTWDEQSLTLSRTHKAAYLIKTTLLEV